MSNVFSSYPENQEVLSERQIREISDSVSSEVKKELLRQYADLDKCIKECSLRQDSIATGCMK